ncbi:MAG: ribonuclease III [Pseudomonadota bacterium]
MIETLAELENKLGYTFQDQKLLIKALTHSSTGFSSTGTTRNYERLEFLGDRVLGLIMADILFKTFQDDNEGNLAKRHSALVQGKTLSDIALENDLGTYVIMSDSERSSGGETNENILADVMEGLLGALYLDGGLPPARQLIETWWGDRIQTMDKAPQDPKTALQEWVQARGLPLPAYEIASREGPDHAPVFVIQVQVMGEKPIEAEGPSRRQAEKIAAEKMLNELKKGR